MALFLVSGIVLAALGAWDKLIACLVISMIIGFVLMIMRWYLCVVVVINTFPADPAAKTARAQTKKVKTDLNINLDTSHDCSPPDAQPSDWTHYNEYLKAFRKLTILENNGLDDCDEAKQLRAMIDFHWLKMTASERHAAELAKADLWKLPEE